MEKYIIHRAIVIANVMVYFTAMALGWWQVMILCHIISIVMVVIAFTDKEYKN